MGPIVKLATEIPVFVCVCGFDHLIIMQAHPGVFFALFSPRSLCK